MQVRVSDVLRVCAERWYIIALGLGLTGVVAIAVLISPGVYFARTQVVFLGPPVPARPNKLDSSSDGLISTAGLIEREMNATRTRIPATGADVTLVDQGVYDGEQIKLPNNGGQWATNFNEPLLDVQATGPNADVVERRIDEMVAEISAILDRRQDEANADESNRITIMLSPAETQVRYMRGDRKRAVAVSIVLGGCMTVSAAVLLDRTLGRRRRMSKKAGPKAKVTVAST